MELLKPTLFAAIQPQFVKVTDDPTVCYAMDVSTPEEVLEAADQSYSRHVILPYNELVLKTLTEHDLYGRLILCIADREELVSKDCLAVKYGIDQFRLYPGISAAVTEATIQYMNN